MKKSLVVLMLVVAVIGTSACSSNARIGTRKHHVSVGGAIR
jgi:hypothetical protein